MKKLALTTITFLWISISYSQITQEYTFQVDNSQTTFGVLCLDKSGLKYAIYSSDTVKLYNTDHSLFKKFKIELPNISGGYAPPMYFTENLFDTDDDIEYVFTTTSNGIDNTVKIVNEQGTVEETFPNSSLFIDNAQTTYDELKKSFETFPIFNVGENAKMILLNNSGGFTLYNLPGKLNCDCNTGTSTFSNSLKSVSQLKTYPNPANEYFKVAYELPNGVNQASLELFDSKGSVIKTYTIDRTFNDLLINTSDLKSGIYVYRIKSGNSLIGSNKIVIDKK